MLTKIKTIDWNVDSDLDFFKDDTIYRQVDICGLAEKMQSKNRILFNLKNEVGQLNTICENLPKKNEVIKSLSVGGGWSALAFIKWVGEKEKIEEMFVSTFRIGKKHFQELQLMYQKNQLGIVHFVTSATQKKVDGKAVYNGTNYNYYDYIQKVYEENGWDLKIYDNHSKLILMQTKENYYVLETSSNLNENPKMEQFSFENDEKLFNFYKQIFEVLLVKNEND